MSDFVDKNHKAFFSINSPQNYQYLTKVCHALSSVDRLRILRILNDSSKNLYEISQILDLPISSVSKHIDVLTDSQLVFVSYKPGPKGHVKLCTKNILDLEIGFENIEQKEDETEQIYEMPIGNYTGCNVEGPCGMVGISNKLIEVDRPELFFENLRTQAELIWFNSGYLSYKFPNSKFKNKDIKLLEFSFEVCSEAPYYRLDWPSDITVKVNDQEIVTFVSPGDYGGRKGIYTPEYWPISSTQYGLLHEITINSNGVYFDKKIINKNININNLELNKLPYIKFTIGIKEDAVHKGGINLFGKNFGNYNQPIIMKIK